MFRLILTCACASVLAHAQDFVALEQDVAPRVEYAIDEGSITIRADNPHAKVGGRLVLARERAKGYRLSTFPARIDFGKDGLGAGDLRIGLEMSWFRADGSLRERRVYFSDAEGNRLPRDIARLKVFDLKRHLREVADRQAGIYVGFDQKDDGFATLVIEDANGTRVRNLVSAQPFKAGAQRVEWDGRDEFGSPVAPGTYRVRGLTHTGIRQNFLMQFANGDEDRSGAWGANHSMMTALAANDQYVFSAARLTEGGYMLTALTQDGKFVRGYEQANWRGTDFVALAADKERIYLAMQGHTFDVQRDMRPRLALAVYDIASEKVKWIGGVKSTFVYESTIDLKEYEKHVQGSMHDSYEQPRILAGLACHGGKLYLANREAETVAVIDPVTLKVEKAIPLKAPAAPVVADGRLYVASGNDVVVLDAAAGRFEKAFTLPFAPTALSFRAGRFAVLGSPDSTVKLYDAQGRACGTIGEPGGAYAGAWRPKRLVHPVGVAFAADGAIWTAEKRTNPKRIVRWSPQGEILYTKYGCPGYGSPSCAFDPEDATRMIAENVEWKIDYAKKTATPVNVLWAEGRSGGVFAGSLQSQIARYRGKTYVIGMGHVLKISEWQADGSLKLVAALSNFYDFNREARGRCAPLLAVVEKNFPGYFADRRNWYRSKPGIFWRDGNGDGAIQEEEFQLMPKGTPVTSFWGITTMGLKILFPFKDEGGAQRIVTLAPAGLRANGVLDYDLDRAFAQSKTLASELPVGSRGIGGATACNDLRGNVLLNTSPWMMDFDGDGRLRWFYQNKWNDVHGSHGAPLQERGMVLGFLFALGTAPLDAAGDVTAIMSNIGPVYLMTSDGLFVDQLFHDGRVYSSQDFNNNAGEPFGGTFQYDRNRKKYMLQVGHGGYRLYDVRGFESIKRFAGEITVTREQIECALRRNPSAAAEEAKEKSTRIPHVDSLAGRNFPAIVNWKHGAIGCRVSGAVEKETLVLSWKVDDPSPWKNNGANWTLLFKTGDSVDVQLALDKSLTGKTRRDAAPGDIRLLIAPFEGKNVAVLYRYRLPRNDGAAANPVGFSSPWRTYTVADVKRLPEAGIDVRTTADGYTVTARVPLASLGTTAADLAGAHRGDFGVVFGDTEGKVNLSRSYWANKETGLVNDVPGEIAPAVKNWGKIEFGGGK